MATRSFMVSRIRLTFNHGLDQEGKPILKAKSYSNVKEVTTPEQILAVSQAIESLCSYELHSIQQNDTAEITG
ncbi:hypothetical protein GCM10008967_36540 [Bacillus carboniphilus]|uniref:DUF1659 domain-containing protein n=1 Tax=Bacillus carboniphilus TaxID=86663 RepID=A0ABP3GDI9_9BACI